MNGDGGSVPFCSGCSAEPCAVGFVVGIAWSFFFKTVFLMMEFGSRR